MGLSPALTVSNGTSADLIGLVSRGWDEVSGGLKTFHQGGFLSVCSFRFSFPSSTIDIIHITLFTTVNLDVLYYTLLQKVNSVIHSHGHNPACACLDFSFCLFHGRHCVHICDHYGCNSRFSKLLNLMDIESHYGFAPFYLCSCFL